MDDKDILKKLLKIAENQQKIIMKLAQGLPPDALPTSQVGMTSGTQAPPVQAPPPTELKPGGPTHTPNKVLYESLGPNLQKAVRHINPPVGSSMDVIFNRGHMTQANYNAVLATLTKLIQGNQILGNYTLVPKQV